MGASAVRRAWPLPSATESQLAWLYPAPREVLEWPMAEPDILELARRGATRGLLNLEGMAKGRADLAVWEIQGTEEAAEG